MKTFIFLLCLLCSFVCAVDAQDVIQKRDGEKIECKVTEITATTIKYQPNNQTEGPIRNIDISEVAVVVYPDGSFDYYKPNENSTQNLNDKSIEKNEDDDIPEKTILNKNIRLDEVVLLVNDNRDGPITLKGDKFAESGKFIHLNARFQDKKGKLSPRIAKLFHEKFLAHNVIFYGDENHPKYILKVTVDHLYYGGKKAIIEECSASVQLISNQNQDVLFQFSVSDKTPIKKNLAFTFEDLVCDTVENTVIKIINNPKFQSCFKM
ncbi:MAG: hypothetical protein JXP36_03610 [Bacteroidales bacterium]|nr:hypothetical protein [Bacteroidales bacterium]